MALISVPTITAIFIAAQINLVAANPIVSFKLTNLGKGALDENVYYAIPEGFNNSGEVVGSVEYFDTYRPFLYRNNSFAYLTQFRMGQASAINDLGQLLESKIEMGSLLPVVIYNSRTGTTTPIPLLDPLAAFPVSLGAAINNNGQVTGVSGKNNTSHAFLHQQGQVIDLTPDFGGSRGIALNNAGTVLIQVGGLNSAAYMVYRNGQLTNLNFTPLGIDDQGNILHVLPTGETALYNQGAVTNLGDLGTPRAISGNGSIVGFGLNGMPFIYANGILTDVNLVGTAEWIDFYSNFQILGINNRGQILGIGSFNGTPQGFLASPATPGRK